MPEMGTTDRTSEYGLTAGTRARQHVGRHGGKYITWALVAFIGIPALPAAIDVIDVVTGKSQTELDLSAAMSNEFGLTTVNCSSLPGRWRDIFGQPPAVTEHLPLTHVYSWIIHARHDTCDVAERIGQIDPKDSRAVHNAGLAITALTFEGERTQNKGNGGIALCYALQRGRGLMGSLGATVAVMDAVQEDVASSLHGGNLAPYSSIPRPGGCHDGGPLDLHPDTPDLPGNFG